VQNAEQLIELLRAHVEREFAKLGSSNCAGVRVKSVGDWWEADPESKLFKMAERALTREWGRQPLFVREGGTMPVRTHPLASLLFPLCVHQTGKSKLTKFLSRVRILSL
jgi:Cys-Gly metallodipeptidase DUG1